MNQKDKENQRVLDLANKLKHAIEARNIKNEPLYDAYYASDKANKIFTKINQLSSLVFSPQNLIVEPVLETDMGLIRDGKWFIKAIDDFAKTIPIQLSKNETEISRIVDDSLITGTGIGKIILDSRNQSVKIIRISPNNFALGYPQLGIDDDDQIIGIRTYFTEKTVKNKYPKAYAKMIAVKEEAEQTRRHEIVLTNLVEGETAGFINRRAKAPATEAIEPLYEVIEVWEKNPSGKLGQSQWEYKLVISDEVVEKGANLVNPFFLLKIFNDRFFQYGFSVIDLLVQLQQKLDNVNEDIDTARSLLAQPPTIIAGFNINEDQAQAVRDKLRIPGDVAIVEAEQGVKIQPYQSGMNLQAAFEEKQFIENDINEILSLTSIMQGQPAPNVRNASYARILASFASAPVKKIAVALEKGLTVAINKIKEIMMNGITQEFEIDGIHYFLANLSSIRFSFKIYAHTASPIIVEENANMLMELAQTGIIPKEILVDILPNIPFRDEIKEQLQDKEKMAKILGAAEPKEPPKKEAKEEAAKK